MTKPRVSSCARLDADQFTNADVALGLSFRFLPNARDQTFQSAKCYCGGCCTQARSPASGLGAAAVALGKGASDQTAATAFVWADREGMILFSATLRR
jgi:hypothetical protein